MYKDIRGWVSPGDVKFFEWFTDTLPNNAHVVEIGSFCGQSACLMVELMNQKGKVINLDTFDDLTGLPDLNGRVLHKIFKENMGLNSAVDNQVMGFTMSSMEGVKLYKNRGLDAVWIDGAHDYHSVTNDVVNWFLKVKLGGIVAGHDYDNAQPEVKRAVHDVLGKVKNIHLNWWVIK